MPQPRAYYNEIDPKAAAWLRELIKGGLIAAGDVDERSIEDIRPADLAGYTQCHFFAGIGGWSYALRLAGWPDDRPVWTGSCPCQPFSTAGKGGGFADERHLWPPWFYLVGICRPAIIFGEQVASQPGLAWLDLVSSDLENTGYSVGAADLCAAGIGAPHIRQRLYWLGVTDGAGRNARRIAAPAARQGRAIEPASSGSMAYTLGDRLQGGAIANVSGTGRREERRQVGRADRASAWAAADWLRCHDGKTRPVEPGTFPLAHGVSGRVGLLRGYGNAIVPQVAAAFIEATGVI